MRMFRLAALFAALSAMAAPAAASVTYSFDFSNLSGGEFEPFAISLTYDDYVTTTGFQPLAAPQPTTLGNDVNFAGTNNRGLWGFDDDGTAVIDDISFFFNGPATFLFAPAPFHSGYITAPGTYAGSVSGIAARGSFFIGTAVLTVEEDTSVPEPAAVGVLGLGMAGLVVTRRRRARARQS